MSVQETARRQSQKRVNAGLAAGVARPPGGWIATVRQALGMSGAQLARRLGVTRSALYRSERSEVAETISLKTLNEIAAQMGCRVVYALVPVNGRIEGVLEAQARRKAEQLVKRADVHMRLESQGLESAELAAQRDELVRALVRTVPSDLWDE